MRLLLIALLADWTRGRESQPRRKREERGFTFSRRSAEHGFTLTELMVVLFILGLLSAIVLINVLPSQDRAMVTKAGADIATLESAMEQYRLDNLTYPGGGDGLNALRSAPASLADPSRYRPGGYIRSLPDDPWGRPYQLAVPGRDGAPFAIYSLGADGAPGGTEENADIYGGEG